MDLDALRAEFHKAFHAEPTIIVRAPGRVNLIGEHTDYNDGFVLPIAIDRAVWIAASACDSQLASITSLDFDESATFRITELEPGIDRGWIAYPTPRSSDSSRPATAPGWAAYPAGVAWSLREAGCALSGIDAALTSDVPIGAGLGSSAALEVACAIAWERLGGYTLPKPDLARLCRRAENEFVGVMCGIMDQTISAIGRAGHALLIDCRDLSTRYIPLPAGYTIIVGDTKVKRELASSGYHERQDQCREAVRMLNTRNPTIHALRDVAPERLLEYEEDLPAVLRKRIRHVVSENARVLESIEALGRGDAESFGRAMIASHASLRDDYEVSCRELDAMVDAALRVEGVVGARMTGAGFGGCSVSLVRDDAVERFLSEVPAAYQDATGIEPAVYVCRAADGASIVSER